MAAPKKPPPYDFAPILADGAKCLLAFSTGKDSLAAWLYCRENGIECLPYYQYQIPGIQFVERSLAYYEKFFGVHILRILHPVLYHWLRTWAYQPPDRAGAIDELDLPRFDYADIQAGVRRTLGMRNGWICVGTKRNDSLMRKVRMAANNIDTGKREFFPIAEWNKSDCLEIIARHGVKLPVDYSLFGRSFDGIDYRFIEQVRQHFPEDYATLKRWFPLIDMEKFRVEVAERHGQRQTASRIR